MISNDGKTNFDVPDKQILDYRITDAGNAETLVEVYGKDFRYCEPLGGWLVWTGLRWEVDNAAIWEVAKNIGKTLQREAGETNDRDDAEKLWSHARYSLGEPGLKRMISLASKDARVRVKPNIFDVNPYLLNLYNGTMDIRTRVLSAHNREDLITKLAPVAFDPEAKAPNWYKFIGQVLPDGGTREYVQKINGRALSGDTQRREFFIHQGLGSNGKNTMYDVLLTLYGDYGQALNIEVLMEKRKGSEASPDLVNLKGKRFVVSSESDEGHRLKSGLIKRLTGDEFITARGLYKDPITFARTFTMFLHVNHKPDVGDTGYAMWNRVRLVPWEVQIPDNQKDTGLTEKLKCELAGILNWLLDGYERYAIEGLEPPGKVKGATNQYRDEQNKLKRFIEERCTVTDQENLYGNDDLWVTKEDLYEAYRSWCEKEGVFPEQKRKFGEHMVELGYEPNASKRVSGRKAKIWKAIALAD